MKKNQKIGLIIGIIVGFTGYMIYNKIKNPKSNGILKNKNNNNSQDSLSANGIGEDDIKSSIEPPQECD